MKTDRKWVIVRIDGKIAAISTDYRLLASITAGLAAEPRTQKKRNKTGKARQKDGGGPAHNEITAVTVGFEEVWKLRQEVRWEDLILYGTDFQKAVWRKLWELTHQQRIGGQHESGEIENQQETDRVDERQEQSVSEAPGNQPAARLISYSDFAELCSNRAGVRAVAHAIGLNPVSVVIPCHLVIPKESIDKIQDIQKKAETTIFKGDDLCLKSILSDSSIDFGEYGLGRGLKRKLIQMELA